MILVQKNAIAMARYGIRTGSSLELKPYVLYTDTKWAINDIMMKSSGILGKTKPQLYCIPQVYNRKSLTIGRILVEIWWSQDWQIKYSSHYSQFD